MHNMGIVVASLDDAIAKRRLMLWDTSASCFGSITWTNCCQDFNDMGLSSLVKWFNLEISIASATYGESKDC